MDFIPQYLEQEFHINLNSQQIEAIHSQQNHILLLAVPGSGKTTVLVSRIAHRILNCGTSSDRILTLTFGRESAHDMNQRFVRLFGKHILDLPHFSTIHSFCLQVLNYYAQRFNRNRPNILAGQSVILLRKIYQEINEEYLTDDMLESLQNDIGLVKNMMITKEELRDYEVTVQNFSQIMERYDAEKKARNLMDYDDMLTFTYDILKKVKTVRDFICGQYDEIYLDEAQDISKLQYEIIKLFGKEKKIFLVGDEDQCIYSFRGAYPEGLKQFSSFYPNAQILKIESNYRCPKDIVAKANEFIKINRTRYPKEMVSNHEKDCSIEEIALEDYSQQYEKVLQLIQKEQGSVAVLYRDNESSIPLLSLLEKNKIPYYCKERSNRGFFNSFVVKDIIAYFHLVFDSKDINAFERVCYHCYCSRSVLIYVKYNVSRYESVWDAAMDCPDTTAYTRKHLKKMETMIPSLQKKFPKQAIELIENKLEYRNYLNHRFDKGRNHITAHLKLNIMKSLAKSFQTIPDFLCEFESLMQNLTHRVQRNSDVSLTLSTVHASKGLEFDTVVLLDFMDGILPNAQAIEDAEYDDREALEGEARLFYVAVTRAKNKLVIYTSKFCNDEYILKSRFITRFLGEDKKLIDKRKNNNIVDIQKLKGKVIRHFLFGEGKIIDCFEDQTVMIQFSNNKVRKMDINSLVKLNLLKLK